MYQIFFLVLLLIAGQQGARIHELGHIPGAHGDASEVASLHASEAGCALCPLYALASSPAFGHSFVLPALVPASPQRARVLPVAAADAAIPAPRSRGPPSLI